ncbi:MAG TPA: galactose mutarotase [Candidatus Pullichristensenella avicola]|nr:galactose mutarotase [Candidatus Pullichristensenella avicola]
MSIRKVPFGKLESGEAADLYILTNTSGASVEITNFGGIIRAINVPDREGKLGNVVLGYKDVSGYQPLCGYLGALIGRVGNRIANGKCVLNGKELTLAKNEGGTTHLHGGNIGFDRKFWDVTPVEGICEDSLILKYTSPDGEEGYPGTLRVMVTYTFTDDNELILHYEAVSDKDTLCNLTNHTYFNLAGEGSGPIYDHKIEIDADTFTVVSDRKCIPTGEMRPVGGTPFDLREPKRIGDGLKMTEEDEQMRFGNGYDHNFNLNGEDEGLRFACEVTEPTTGRVMQVYTDMPAVQFYAGNGLESVNPGSCGRNYHKHEGFCLETQYAPDSINHPEFPDSVLRAGEKYDFITIFAFDAE